MLSLKSQLVLSDKQHLTATYALQLLIVTLRGKLKGDREYTFLLSEHVHFCLYISIYAHRYIRRAKNNCIHPDPLFHAYCNCKAQANSAWVYLAAGWLSPGGACLRGWHAAPGSSAELVLAGCSRPGTAPVSHPLAGPTLCCSPPKKTAQLFSPCHRWQHSWAEHKCLSLLEGAATKGSWCLKKWLFPVRVLEGPYK